MGSIGSSSSRSAAYQSKTMGITDDRGLFAIRNAPWRDLILSVRPPHDPNQQSTHIELTELLVSQPLKVQIELQCAVEIDNTMAPDVDTLHFLTDDGEQLSTTEFRPGVRIGGRKLEVAPNGSFYPASVSQRATQVVLYQDDEEVGRRSIRLEGNVSNKIEL